MRPVLIALALLFLPAATCAGGAADSMLAREAVERGEALALADILAKLRGELGGELVGVHFERKRARWIYEFKIIDGAGRLWEVHVDAASAEILRREGH